MRGGGSLKASLTRVFSLAKNEQAMTQMDNCGECDLGFNPHQEHYRQVSLSSVLSSPIGEGNGINSITNLSPYRPNALAPLAKTAFTMAEILLSLTIIGVVAAITLPSLTGNINERTWNTQRKALYSRMSQAVALMPALNGYGIGATEDETKENAAETFLSAGLSKVLKINNICDSEHLQDCGLPSKIIQMGGKSNISPLPQSLFAFNSAFNFSPTEAGVKVFSYSQLDTNAAAFETANGEAILVYYYPFCKISMNELSGYYVQPKLCANFVYDLNGKKGPNTVGKDVGFITAFYPVDPVVVSPLPLTKDISGSYLNNAQVNIGKICRNFDNESKAPNKEELMALFVNKKLINIDENYYWSSTPIYEKVNYAWRLSFNFGYMYGASRTDGGWLRCINR